MKPLLCNIFCLVLMLYGVSALPSFAQTAKVNSVNSQSSKPPISSGMRLFMPPVGGNERAIEVQSVRVLGNVSGTSALTEIDITFYNPNNRVLEGELQFPLLDGQSIAGFALDLNGVLREAVPVEKARGQTVFEGIVRRGVDPALLETTGGNQFKLRIYPLPPRGTRRVVLRVNETLANNLYRVPLGFGERIGQLDLDVSVYGAASAPVLRASPVAGARFAQVYNGKTRGYHLHESRQNLAGDAALEILLTPTAAPLIQVETFESNHYVVADIPLASREQARAIPNLVGLVWDSSGSARERDRAKEFALLDAYFKKMRDGEVRLMRLRDVAEKTESFRIRGGDWRALREALQNTPSDGATNLSAFVPDNSVREYLLFSDGLSNYGDKPFAQTGVPLYTIASALKADSAFLKQIAQRSGGRLIDLTAATISEASQMLLNASTRVIQVDAVGGDALLMASPFVQNGRVQVAGLLSNPAASLQLTLQLTLQHPDGVQENLSVSLSDAIPSSTAAQRWASLKVAALDAEYSLNKAEIKRLGQRFKLVTRETSLIVLEFVHDYAQYEITPPAELRADYDRLIANLGTQKRSASSNHLEQIVRAFEQKVQWWNQAFSKKGKADLGQDKAKVSAVTGNTVTSLQEDSDGLAAERSRRSNDMAQFSSKSLPAPAPMAAAAASAPAKREAGSSHAAESLAQPGATNPNNATIRLQKWEPDAAYAKRLKDTPATDLYRVYLDEAPNYLNSTAFYLDAADIFFEKGLHDLGLRVVSNLAEMDLENRHILRVLGYRLMQAKRPALAIPVLKKVLALSPEEPQSYRDLGLAYAKNNQAQLAIDTLHEVLIRPWHNRFPGVELITLAELNAIVATAASPVDTGKIDRRLLKNLPLGLRAVLMWDADNTDIDLWVTDPNGERAFYANPLTVQGGRMSADFTSGYGPEEFSLKQAMPGKYRVEANYFGDRRQNLTGVTSLQVQLITGFGTPQAREQMITLRLKSRSETIFVGEFEVK